MKKSEFKNLIKECMIDIVKNDHEFRSALLETIGQAGDVINESLPKEPADPELYDSIMLVGQGKMESIKHNGKVLKSPNMGNGFKSPKMLKEWSDKAYSKVGGEWQNSTSYQNSGDAEALREMASAFFGDGTAADGGVDQTGAFQLASLAMSGQDRVLKEQLKKSGVSVQLTDIAEDSKPIDMTDILLDTAKRTLPAYLANGKNADTAGGVDPEKDLGIEPGRWAKYAF